MSKNLRIDKSVSLWAGYITARIKKEERDTLLIVE